MSELIKAEENKKIEEFLERISLKDAKINFEMVVLKTLFKTAVTNKIPEIDFIKFVHKCQQLGANPTLDQAFLLPYKDYQTGKISGQILFHYSFMEAVANREADYGGFTRKSYVDNYFDPEKMEEKKMLRCDVVVIRNGREFPFTAWFCEYAKTKKSGEVYGVWKTAPYMMIEKCALAGALRRAYPEAMSGLYISEEQSFLGNAENSDIRDIETENEKRKKDYEKTIEEKQNLQNVYSGKIDDEVEKIKTISSDLTREKSTKEKIEFMKKFLDVSKFDDLKKKKLEDLEIILEGLKHEKEKTKKQNPTFILSEKKSESENENN